MRVTVVEVISAFGLMWR